MSRYYIIFMLSAFIASISQILLKKSALVQRESILKEYFNIYVILGYIFLFISTFLTSYSYRGIPLSLGPILNSTSYIFVGILSYFILKENLGKKRVVGYLVIIIGIIISSL